MRTVQEYKFTHKPSVSYDSVAIALRKAGYSATVEHDSVQGSWWLRTDASLMAIGLALGNCQDLTGPMTTVRFN